MVGFFDNAYRDGGTPTWDVGRPQGAVVRLARTGLVTGSVLDAGCGTGENALHLAELGHAVLGVDFAVAAIERAAAKAAGPRPARRVPRRGRARSRRAREDVRHGPRRRALPHVRGCRAHPVRREPRGRAPTGRAGLPALLERPQPVRARPAADLAAGDPGDIPRGVAGGGDRPRVARHAPPGRSHPRLAGADHPGRRRDVGR